MLFVVLLFALAVVIASWWWNRATHDVRSEVERFKAAREMTSRWAADPTSAPRPVLDIAERGGQPVDDAPDPYGPEPAASVPQARDSAESQRSTSGLER